MTDRRLCTVYRSPRHEGMYLFVDKKEDLARVPSALLERFGRPQLAMTLLLTPDKQLARAEVGEVLAKIQEQGFYLQLPPRDPILDGAQQ